MPNLYNVPDKSVGQTWTSGEHNQLKQVVNDTVGVVNADNIRLTNAEATLADVANQLNPSPQW